MKRYMILVQHEVVIYAENEKSAKANLMRNMANRTNPQCVFIQEIPLPKDEKIDVHEYYDNRKTPGA